ncbi:MAG TPA: hybrid sensor histidine kinase/response regulator [Microcoleaceae bacterium UBA10368]|jgi:Bacteriophytochrome (light-regulated signal transduction histidine kinase)|nr:hybrid sensor histidine kinase/response regulator [Microcoleaceae cyanobacterium UBA10368]HCV30621.1 hybrid sensor histidine kinase/response regulator [Microcoleaceae cyanobacterium UBA9251]
MDNNLQETLLGNILVVDDTPENLRLLSTMLSQRGYVPRCVINGQMALRACNSHPPDLILLDIMMPQMNGYEVCQHLKLDAKTRDIPVIFISAKDEVFDKVNAFTVGGVDYISKPFQFEEVLARIESHLTLRKLQNQLKEQNILLQQEISSRLAVEKDLQEKNLILQKEISSRRAVEKALQEQNLLLQQEIFNRECAESALLKSHQELARYNAELEQFAYVASHDLQAPLATIVSYAQLLEKRSKDKLDSQANKFIGNIVYGCMRMQNLIDDLLEYSRFGRSDKLLQQTDCNQVFEQAIANLQGVIRDTEAVVCSSELPVVHGEISQLVQLFQNLVGNAIKYRQDAPPVVSVSACKHQDHWLFSVSDNGIGIAQQHQERIFKIFQRLHTQKEYSGTGIGLAICQKIVQRHGGRIWVESEPGQGSTFRFTLNENTFDL